MLAGRKGSVLIDCGEDWLGHLDRLKPSAILVTHGHPDHIGAIGQFSQARVMALEAEVPLVEGRAGAKGPVPRLFPVSPTGVKVDQVLHDGEVVMLDSLPVRVYPEYFALVTLASLAICLLAALYPARQAAALVPVEIIRYE